MRVYQLNNPSDPYTFLAPDREVAALLCLAQGGQINATLLDDDGQEVDSDAEQVPFFMFQNSDNWFQKHFGRNVEKAFMARREELAEAMLSVLYGNWKQRQEFNRTLELIHDHEERQHFIDKWHDKRSSMSDIGGYFRDIGRRISEVKSEETSVREEVTNAGT